MSDNHYEKSRFGGNREKAIQRDGEKCVRCGMTREEHKEIYGRDITVDHIDGNGYKTPVRAKNNDLSNLQTLCMYCHGTKDGVRPHYSFGESHHRAKLTKKDVIYIAKRDGKVTAVQLAQRFGVSPDTVRRIQLGVTWSRITGIPRRIITDNGKAKRRAAHLTRLAHIQHSRTNGNEDE